jgi:predicted regulator of Ras-like GTPase activity (Roadblock/LC7/MglB family)
MRLLAGAWGRPRQGAAMIPLSKDAQNLNWLVSTFVRNVPGVAHAIVVSSDGLLIAVSEQLERDRGDQLAAIASGVASLTAGTSRLLEAGEVNQTIVEMERGFLIVMSVSDGSCLAVLASPSCDIGVIGYEMALLVARTGDVLTPQLRAELQAALPL